MEKTKVKHRVSSTAALLIVLGILVAFNVVVAGLKWRADLTDEKLYTLSDGTKTMLKDLDRDVTLKFYFSKSAEGSPIPLKQFAQRVEELLREYELNGGGKVVLETYDPTPDSDEEEWAQRYGVRRQSLGMLGGGPALYLGLAAVSGAREGVIPVFSPSQEPQLEYLVTRLIFEVTQTRRPKVGVMSSLPVLGEPGAPFAPRAPGREPWVVMRELQRSYEMVPVPLTADRIPDDVDVLLLVQPASLSDATLYALDQYVLGGGRLFAFVDPASLAQQETSPETPPMPGGRELAAFNKLLKAWGLDMDGGRVVADLTYATRVRTASGDTGRNITWLSLRDESIDRDELATGSLESLLLPVAGAFTGEPAEGLSMTRLLVSSAKAGFVNAFQASFTPDGGLRDMAAAPGPVPLAVRLRGTFKTAFPEGKPKDPAATTEEAGEETTEEQADGLRESEKEGVVLLVADSDLLYDRFCVRAMNFFGQTVFEPINDNLNFVINMVEQLAGSEALIGLRGRGTFERPFTRVLELEQEAQDRWRQEEQELQAKLQATQARINELQANKDPNQQYILSPEQQREIKRFQDERFQTQKALKEVRKELRRDIERLGMNLKLANMALVPLAVAVFGVVRGLKRRRG